MVALVKICGVTRVEDAIDAAVLGATHLGFVFFPKSPRFVEAETADRIVTALKRASFEEGFALPSIVGLFVDAGERQFAEAAPFLTALQLHGRETPERCVAIRDAFALEIIKAVPVGAREDAAAASAYDGVADLLLFDARPPKGAVSPGGHGAAFDWALLKSYRAATPFLVAGGLRPDTVESAIAAVGGHPGFAGVDVSSGVEDAPGRKSRDKMQAFVEAARRTTH